MGAGSILDSICTWTCNCYPDARIRTYYWWQEMTRPVSAQDLLKLDTRLRVETRAKFQAFSRWVHSELDNG